jgi:hypothetical protein
VVLIMRIQYHFVHLHTKCTNGTSSYIYLISHFWATCFELISSSSGPWLFYTYDIVTSICIVSYMLTLLSLHRRMIKMCSALRLILCPGCVEFVLMYCTSFFHNLFSENCLWNMSFTNCQQACVLCRFTASSQICGLGWLILGIARVTV